MRSSTQCRTSSACGTRCGRSACRGQPVRPVASRVSRCDPASGRRVRAPRAGARRGSRDLPGPSSGTSSTRIVPPAGSSKSGFPGVHSDVGGGYPENELSDLALEWMIAEATAIPNPLLVDSTRLGLRSSHEACSTTGGWAWARSGSRARASICDRSRSSARIHVERRFLEPSVPSVRGEGPYRPIPLANTRRSSSTTRSSPRSVRPLAAAGRARDEPLESRPAGRARPPVARSAS